jgi:hypothetical protein
VQLTRVFGSCVFNPTGATTSFVCDTPGTFANHPPFTVLSTTTTAPTCTSTITGVGSPSTVNFTVSQDVTLTIQNANGAVATCTGTLTFSGTAVLPTPLPTTEVICSGTTINITNITITGAGGVLTITVTADVCTVIQTVAAINYLLPEEPALCPAPTPCSTTVTCPLPGTFAPGTM